MPIFSRAIPKLSNPIACAILLAAPLAASAQTTQQAIEARLKGHPLYLRGQWAPNDLKFDLAGTTASPSVSAPFTLCGIDVKKVQLTDKQLEIDGDRVGLEFDHDNPTRISLHTSLKIKIAGSSGADYTSALDKIFADGLPALVPSMPFYWQKYAQAHLIPPDPPTATAGPATPPRPAPKSSAVSRTPQHLNASPATTHFPRVLSSVEPMFTDAARQLQYRGSSLVGIIVKEDGTVHEPHIVRPAGLGLDEQALLAVAQYRFKPATDNNGTPIASILNIEVNFGP